MNKIPYDVLRCTLYVRVPCCLRSRRRLCASFFPALAHCRTRKNAKVSIQLTRLFYLRHQRFMYSRCCLRCTFINKKKSHFMLKKKKKVNAMSLWRAQFILANSNWKYSTRKRKLIFFHCMARVLNLKVFLRESIHKWKWMTFLFLE